MVQNTFPDGELFEAVELGQHRLDNIQRSLMISSTGCSIDPFMLQLADENTARVFIQDSNLEKVCRTVNKSLHFWLFSDCIIYGNSLVRGRYQSLRKLDLLTCSIAIFPSMKYEHAMKISDAEKSFVVVAPTEYLQKEWLHYVTGATQALNQHPGLTGPRKSNLQSTLPGPAPKTHGILVDCSIIKSSPPNEAVECAVCIQVKKRHNNIECLFIDLFY